MEPVTPSCLELAGGLGVMSTLTGIPAGILRTRARLWRKTKKTENQCAPLYSRSLLILMQVRIAGSSSRRRRFLMLTIITDTQTHTTGAPREHTHAHAQYTHTHAHTRERTRARAKYSNAWAK